MTAAKPITITRVGAEFEREPLVRPFGFKGGYQSEIWQSVARIESSDGKHGTGLCTQGVLWSDAHVFAGHSESGGNALMYVVTEHALQQLKGQRFTNPVELLDGIRHDVYAFAKKITNQPGLRETFALNALVGVDNAAWLLYAAENGIANFDDLIPPVYRPA